MNDTFDSSLSSSNSSSPSSSSAAGPSAELISALEGFDVHAELDFSPRRDVLDGTAPADAVWHDGYNALANDTSTPYFIANGWGPKYLAGTDDSSFIPYHIVQPLVSPAVSGATFNYTLSKITISRGRVEPGSRVATISSIWPTTITTDQSMAFEVLEGLLAIEIAGYQPAQLTAGDVIFIPARTNYTYASVTALTVVLSVCQGRAGLDQRLIATGRPWTSVTFPPQ